VISSSFSLLAHAEEPGAPSEPAPRPAADLPPPGARTTHLVAGVATTGVAYGLAVGVSYLSPDYRGASDLRIPVAGPWMALGRTGCPKDDPNCSPVLLVIGAILAIADGVAQAGGLAIVGEGLFLKTSSARPAAKKAQGPTWRAVPLDLGKDGAGLGVVGTF
jgi:hypothetical protein